ncbi:hypothetical protein D8804_08645 [Streptococcus oralis]|uniref:Uncharacterized protein n=1 Tax=Streptococcus oralis TaxID=1303 RepID=A0A3R9LDG1_STROR|nr:hypothetical protein D8804_08645 [Streptococcus oralis]
MYSLFTFIFLFTTSPVTSWRCILLLNRVFLGLISKPDEMITFSNSVKKLSNSLLALNLLEFNSRFVEKVISSAYLEYVKRYFLAILTIR